MKNKQRTGKRWLAALLSLVMTLCLATTAFAAGFADVPANAWYRDDVEYAVKNGLVDGTSPTTYSPDDNLTYAAAVKLAAAMHKKVTLGSTDFAAGSPWYQPYVDYAKANKIITKDYAWNSAATRAGYMEIFAGAIPDKGLLGGYRALEAINTVDDDAIPDVSSSHPQASAIYKLYRAGIVQGTDAARSCAPDSFIKRSEVAAILTRMMDSTKRMTFTLSANANELKITAQPQSTSVASDGKCTLSVTVSGGKSPYSYQWYLSNDGTNWLPIVNNSKYSGVNTAALTVKADDSDSGSKRPVYRCVIADTSHKSVTTTIVKVDEEKSALTITEQPQSVSANVDDWAAFTVAVSGGKAPYTYQWQYSPDGGINWGYPVDSENGYLGSKTDTLKVKVGEHEDEYAYRCIVKDASGKSVTSDAAKITLRTSTVTRPTAPLTITAQPQSKMAAENAWVTLTVTASGGAGETTYQWQHSSDSGNSWGDIKDNPDRFQGGTTNTLKVKVVHEREAFLFRCVVRDKAGTRVNSETATVTANSTLVRPSSTPLTITEQPRNVTARKGDKVSFTVAVSGGTGDYTYQWQWSSRDGGDWVDLAAYNYRDVSGYNTASLTIAADDYQYRCVVWDGSKSVTSKAVYIDLK